MWRTRLTQAVNWLRSRRLVGEDGRHEFYSEYIGSGVPEKRYVEFKDREICDSSSGMPTEWWAWLHNRRDDPPTVAEIDASRARAEKLAQRVRALEAEDARQRLRQFAGAAPRKGDVSDVKRERVKERLLRSANEKAAATHVPATKSDSTPGTMQKNTGEGTEAFEPEAWTPPTTKWRR